MRTLFLSSAVMLSLSSHAFADGIVVPCPSPEIVRGALNKALKMSGEFSNGALSFIAKNDERYTGHYNGVAYFRELELVQSGSKPVLHCDYIDKENPSVTVYKLLILQTKNPTTQGVGKNN